VDRVDYYCSGRLVESIKPENIYASSYYTFLENKEFLKEVDTFFGYPQGFTASVIYGESSFRNVTSGSGAHGWTQLKEISYKDILEKYARVEDSYLKSSKGKPIVDPESLKLVDPDDPETYRNLRFNRKLKMQERALVRDHFIPFYLKTKELFSVEGRNKLISDFPELYDSLKSVFDRGVSFRDLSFPSWEDVKTDNRINTIVGALYFYNSNTLSRGLQVLKGKNGNKIVFRPWEHFKKNRDKLRLVGDPFASYVVHNRGLKGFKKRVLSKGILRVESENSFNHNRIHFEVVEGIKRILSFYKLAHEDYIHLE